MADDPQFCGLEVFLNNILTIGLLGSNNRMIMFSKTENKIISQQTPKRPYIYDAHIEVELGDLKNCKVFADFFLFLNKRFIV